MVVLMAAFLIILFFLLLHTYFFYPLILVAMTWKAKSAGEPSLAEKPEYCPRVSVIVSAYNEEENIDRKIDNFMALDYPPDNAELLLGSDGSTDKTAFAARRRENERIRFFDFTEQRGKAAVLNDVVKDAKGEIIIFSDAETMFEKGALRDMVSYFEKGDVGGVCGKLELYGDEHSLAEEGLYWRYENFIKEKESEIKSVVSINGQIFAVRKSLFEPFPERAITEDQILGMRILKRGYNVKFASRAVGKEKIGSLRHEFRRRVRISAGNFRSIGHFWALLNPAKGFVAFALWSHKILRWLAPFFLIGMFITGFLLSEIVFIRAIFAGQFILFLILPAAWLALKPARKNRVLSAVFYFDIMNLAVLAGFVKFLFRRQKSAWKS